ncbi:cysteine proteinase [Crassisporium funariophilum]|nr:cysteine proteinase [Crassisporium funariophilum]
MVVLPVLLTEDSEAKLVHDMELTNAAGSLINGISGVSGASSVSALSPKTKACKTTVIGATQNQVGLLVTAELEKSLKDCKVKVDRIAKECRAGNRKFRDLEFDLGNNKKRCLQGLSSGLGDPPDVRRVTEIYENPKFFVDGPDSNDIVQGELGNCGFLSALSTISTSKGLIEELCVARDEEVGVYGFVFFQGDKWVHVIIDDQLFWSLPKYEELEQREKELYHEDKEMYNKLSRKLGKGLHFAKSGTEGETWVPLIEKAYAKLHGDFESLEGGWSLEAIEEMTGGISITYRSKDILDVDRFWHEELMHATHDRLFGCSFTALENNRNQSEMIRVQGLYSGHAYSILRVKECRGKRFIVIRNPWGKCEWTGRWSDGSKDWNGEWAQVLKELDHVLGDDGEFVMEYSDFLDTWELIERTTIFGPSWKLSSLWLQVPDSPRMHPWTYGDVMFYFTLPKPSFTFIVLSQLDTRNLKQLHGTSMWHLDFVIYKRGETECRGASTYAYLFSRSVLCELELEAGEYVVYPRLDREYVGHLYGSTEPPGILRYVCTRDFRWTKATISINGSWRAS